MKAFNKSKVFTFTVLGVCLIFLAVVRYYGAGNSQGIDPTKLNVINFTDGGYHVYDKHEPLAQELIHAAYGPYADWVLNTNIELSIPEETEFALPTFKSGGKFLALRESPTISFRLWQQAAPDVVLLGSSMFFMNFNRTTFYKQYPNKHLVDMTMGNNTPLLSEYILNTADKLDLKIKPGTVFLYGMNAVELLDFYYPPFPHIERAFALSLGTEPLSKMVEIHLTNFLHVAVVKELLDNWVRAWVVDHRDALKKAADKLSMWLSPVSAAYAQMPDVAKGAADPYAAFVTQAYRYSPYVPPELESKPQELAALLKRMAPPWDGKSYDNYKYGSDKVAALKRLSQKIKAAGGTLILIKVPTSTLGFYRSPSSEHSFHQAIAPLVKELDIPYVDLTSMEKTGLDDRDFVYPRHEINPEHLNFEGSDKFTRYILSNILKPLWRDGGKS